MAIKAVFDASGNWVAYGRDAGAGETARNVEADAVREGAIPGRGHWDATNSVIVPGPAQTAALRIARRRARIHAAYREGGARIRSYWAHDQALLATRVWWYQQPFIAATIDTDAAAAHLEAVALAVPQAWYGVMVGNSTLRAQWAAASVASGGGCYSDIFTSSTGAAVALGDIDGAYTTFIWGGSHLALTASYDPESPTLVG